MRWNDQHHEAARAVVDDDPLAIVSYSAVRDILRFAWSNGTLVVKVCDDIVRRKRGPLP